MCFGGGGSVNTGPQHQLYAWNDDQGNPQYAVGEVGIPLDYVQKGATTVSQYQQMAASDLSDKQIAAQKEIADQQNTLNEKQFQAQQDQWKQQQDQAQAQADRQSTYDQGRAKQAADAQTQIDSAFSRFSPDYFKQYASDYMAKATDPITYQEKEAQKQLAYATARQGISSSQANVNEQGKIQETAGRATDQATADASDAVSALKQNVANARQNLATQVGSAESIGSPIAGSTIDDVNSALETQRNAISGISSTAGDVATSLQATPQVNTLGNIFAGVLGTGGSLLGGIQSGNVMSRFNAGLSGTNPSGSSTA
jgi:membrane protein involved in colicin uptake